MAMPTARISKRRGTSNHNDGGGGRAEGFPLSNESPRTMDHSGDAWKTEKRLGTGGAKH